MAKKCAPFHLCEDPASKVPMQFTHSAGDAAVQLWAAWPALLLCESLPLGVALMTRHWLTARTRQPWSPRQSARTYRRRAAAFFPQVESLESRWVPTTVTNLNDSGAGSLRQAILDTPALGTVDFRTGLRGTITLTTGELVVDKSVTIVGPGADSITISANHASRVLTIPDSFHIVTITGLTFTNGRVLGIPQGTRAQGGGIFNAGVLTLANSIISDNSTESTGRCSTPLCTVTVWAEGGGIYNSGTLALINSAVIDNSVTAQATCTGFMCRAFTNADGGGIYNSGRLTVSDTFLAHNVVDGIESMVGDGGAIANLGWLTITSSTILDNYSGESGGGISSNGPMFIISNSLVGNNSSTNGGGILAGRNTLVSGSDISGNSAIFGGGIYSDGNLILADSMVRGNQGPAIYNDGEMTILESIITGNTGGSIGGIINSGTMAISDSVISDNSAIGGTITVGGIGNVGDLIITNSTLFRNTASGGEDGGGGVYNEGTLNLIYSTVWGNAAIDGNIGGGGISNFGTATVTISTITGNITDRVGGGIRNSSMLGGGRLVIAGSTITGNEAASGGGVHTDTNSVTEFKNTLIAANRALDLALDISGMMLSQGHNLIGDGTGGSGFHPTDLVGTAENPIDPLLGPLGDYGGPTFTHALLPGSPALDAGDNTDAPEFDQRGFTRIVNGIVDIGAFEVQAPASTGPIVIGQSIFRNLGPVSSLRVTFDRPIDVTTFTPEDVFYFEGPLGFLPVTAVAVVPGSGDREFEITFPTQVVTGVYGLHIGPHIFDRAGHAMNQNQDELLGWSDDYYTASFGIEGPRVVASSPSGTVTGSVAWVRLTFSVPIDPATFTRRDVVSFTGPEGRVAVRRIAVVPDSNNTQFDVVLREPLELEGAYRMELWPGIYDTWGNPLDQDNDLIGGEGPEDGYVTQFTIDYADPFGGPSQDSDLAGILAILMDDTQREPLERRDKDHDQFPW